MDSFKQLLDDEQEIVVVPEQKIRDIERKVHRVVQPMRFAASTTELFLPRVFDTVLALFGSENSKKSKKPSAISDDIADPASHKNW
jgi:hypothetical protein